MPTTSHELIDKAIVVARRGLRWCYRERGILSGSRMVYWSWDSFFASFGALCLGDHDIVRRNLELYLSYQNEAGSVPKRIANPWYFLRYAGFPISEAPKKQRPTFWTSYYTAKSLTQNPTLVLAFGEYVRVTGDTEFLAKHADQLHKIMAYLETQESERGLLKEGLGGGWAESVLKRGAITFTNVCYARALEYMAELCGHLGDIERRVKYRHKYLEIKQRINETLWFEEDGGYYSDWYGHRRHHHFATDGNLLAILWDIATPEQAEKIQAKIAFLSLEDDIPIKLAYDKYDFWRIYIFNRIGGIKDYHVGFSWTWLGCIDALAKQKMGRTGEAQDILARIAAVIVRDRTVHEIYDNGRAVKTLFYKSEHPWGWGAGLFVYAAHQLGYQVTEKP